MTIRNETLSTFNIDVHSRITSEVEYEIHFRHIQSRNLPEATVETNHISHPMFRPFPDVLFGSRADPNNPLDPLEAQRTLEKGRLEPLGPRFATILSDLRVEPNECFSLYILTSGERTDFSCNDNADNPDDFFCDHTVCILDNDG